MNVKIVILIVAVVLSGCKKEYAPNDPGNLVPRTVDQDLSFPAISINGIKLHSETYGSSADPMVVILHGGPGSDYRAMLNCKDLANNGYFVVFYDQRGSGLSQRVDKDTYSVQLMLDDLTAVIQHYRSSPAQKVFLFGHSWGAMLATAYINTYPTAISGAILSEPGGFTWEDTKGYISRSQSIDIFAKSINDVFYQDQFITGKENEQDILDYKAALSSAADVATGNMVGNAGPYPFWRFGAVVEASLFKIGKNEGFNFTTHLNQFQTKVLFLYSELNRAYGVQYAKRVSSAYPNADPEKINGSGHQMIYFAWDNVYSLALPYLNSLK
jgi:proline iminopeptidase